MHRTITNYTQDGLIIEEATAQGAQLEAPPDANLQDRYDMPDFERKITMPDHVRKPSGHLDKLMRRFGRMEKTMVSARTWITPCRLPRNSTASLLEKFRDTEKRVPVITTTVDLLTTGVDAPSVRNVVFMKPVASVVSFKQIVGRGSRLCPDTDKFASASSTTPMHHGSSTIGTGPADPRCARVPPDRAQRGAPATD